MSNTTLTDAARLAATLPPDTAASPREVDLGPAWLDLRGRSLSAAIGSCGWVGEALGPCLALQESACLFVRASSRHSREVSAIRVANAFRYAGLESLRIATIVGEDVTDRLEEFLVSDCELNSEQPPARSLREEPRAPKGAIALAPPSVFRDALLAGAKVVISCSADRETIERALTDAPEDSDGQERRIRFGFLSGCRVSASFEDPRSSTEIRKELIEFVADGVKVTVTESDGSKRLDLESPSGHAMEDACRRCNLLLRGLHGRLSDSVRSSYDEWTTRVPAGMLPFDHDIRTAAEWLEYRSTSSDDRSTR